MIAGSEPYTERVFRSAPSLRVVARFGVGHDRIDEAAATRHGVAVAMAFGTNHEPVADGTLALLLACARDLPRKHILVASGGWGSGFDYGIWRKTMGIIGLGRIRQAVARRARLGFEIRVLAADPAPPPGYPEANGSALPDLDTLLRESDFVSLHVPHDASMDRLIDAGRLALMKRSAFLINTARGGLIDEEALVAALREGQIAGAGLDVFRDEPPRGSPLLGLNNVVFTPRFAGMDETAERAMGARVPGRAFCSVRACSGDSFERRQAFLGTGECGSVFCAIGVMDLK
jgi:D-3-phosphoglycerate dehydrogenase / 2-oxoglutarate reductase